MRDIALLFIHLLVTIARIFGSGGARSVVAELLLVKHQLLILNRSRTQAPDLRPTDRVIVGLCSALMRPARLLQSAIILKPSSILRFHRALVKRKHRLLFTLKTRGKPGPREPSRELISAIVEMKRRNSNFGYQRIADQISLVFDIDIDKDVVRRVLARHYRPELGPNGPSWLTFLWSRCFLAAATITKSAAFFWLSFSATFPLANSLQRHVSRACRGLSINSPQTDVAQLIAVNYPEKIRKLVLLDSVCFDSCPIPEFEPLQQPGADTAMSLSDFVGMMRGFMPNGVYDKSAMTDDVIDLYLAPWSTKDAKRTFFRNLGRLNKEYTQSIADELGKLPHQSLVMWGDKDPFQKPEYAAKLADAIPNAELVWIKDAGHWLTDEKLNEIGDRINQFLG